jgi:hypothetical protein
MLNVPICKLIIIVLLFYYAKNEFVSKHQKNYCICKALFYFKNSDQACDYMLQVSLYNLFVKLICLLYVNMNKV